MLMGITHDKFVVKRAYKLFEKFMRYSVTKGQLVERIRDTFWHVTFIQRKYRVLREIIDSRALALRGPILAHQRFLISDELIAERAPKNKQIVQLINSLSSTKLDFVTDCVIGMAKLSFRKAFLNWFAENRLDLKKRENFFKMKELRATAKETEDLQNEFLDFVADLVNYKESNKLMSKIKRRNTIEVSKYTKSLEKQAEALIDQAVHHQHAHHHTHDDNESKDSVAGGKSLVSQAALKVDTEECDDCPEVSDKVLQLLGGMMKKNQQPRFTMNEWLKPQFLRMILIKVTELQENELQPLREKYFQGWTFKKPDV